MEYHPFTAVWRVLAETNFRKLKADIKLHGQREPVLIYKGMLLDGRNRERACRELGIPLAQCEAAVLSDDEALALVVSCNRERVHLTRADRAFAAETLATLRGTEGRRDRTRTLREAAAAVGTSYGSAERARTIRTLGTPEDIEAIFEGRASLTIRADELRAAVRQPKKAMPPREKKKQPRYAFNPFAVEAEILPFHPTPPLKMLTRAQVDPEFTGTATEFADKYGHVQINTAEEYATMRFGDVVMKWRTLARKWREFAPDARPLDMNWLRSPKPYDVGKLRDALALLGPLMAEAQALLACAEAALEKKSRKA